MRVLTVTGVRTSLRCFLSASPISRAGIPSTRPSLRSSRKRMLFRFGRFDCQTCTTSAGTFVTSDRPFWSQIAPRGAGTRTSRRWLFWAARSSCSPFRTCSDQRRRNRTANTASATIPSRPTRRARRGVRRYGSATCGSGGRKRRELTRLAKEPHLARGPVARPQEPPSESVDRDRQDQIQEHGREQAREDQTARSILSQHETQNERSDLIQNRDHRYRHHGRLSSIASGGLAIA